MGNGEWKMNNSKRSTFNVQLSMIVLLSLLLVGCKSSKTIVKPDDVAQQYLSSKVELTIPHGDAVFTVNGTMKMKQGELVQMSFLMPIFRSEVARIEATPSYLLMVDRMNRRYVKANQKVLRDYLPADSYRRLEKLIQEAAKPDGKATMTGQELGIKQLAKAKIDLYDFSSDPINVAPTELTSRYREVTMEELLQLLMSL